VPARQQRLERSSTKELGEDVASRLAKILKVPLRFLTSSAPPPLDGSALRYRTPRSTTLQEKQYMAEFVRFSGEFACWLDGQHRLPPLRVPRFSADHDIADAAQVVRGVLQVGADDPIPHLTHVVERVGVPIIMRVPKAGDAESWDRDGDSYIETPERGERHFGFSAWVGTYYDRPLIVLRAIRSWERTRWTVAHELGHVVLHHSELPADAELAASRFASELLAPASQMEARLQRHVTLADLVPLKLEWGISIGALCRHLHYSRLISDERLAALQRQLYTRTNPTTGRTWGVDEPGWDDRVPERPRLLSRWTETCLGNANPHAVEGLTQFWPADLLETIFAGQRGKGLNQDQRKPASNAGVTSQDPEKVVDLASWRRSGRNDARPPDAALGG
jgi:Zn-dependent peptidase ImmA (M78 family)